MADRLHFCKFHSKPEAALAEKERISNTHLKLSLKVRQPFLYSWDFFPHKGTSEVADWRSPVSLVMNWLSQALL